MADTSDAARWQRMKSLLAIALEQPADQRAAYVEQLTRDDLQMRTELLELLTAADPLRGMLDAVPSRTLLEAFRAMLRSR